MARYQVNYDLRQPGRNYDTLYQRLATWKAVRVLKSAWIIDTNSNAVTIRDDLAKYIDANDGLLVTGMTGEAAWQKLEGSSDQALKRAA